MCAPFAFASWSELSAGRNLPKLPKPVGVRCANGVPDDTSSSGGYAGALVDFLDGKGVPLDVGTVIIGTRVIRLVNSNPVKIETLWEIEHEPMKIPGAVEVTVLDADEIVDDPAKRRWLYEKTGAEAVDMESGVLARERKLDEIVRVISDNPAYPLYGIAGTLKQNGRLSVCRLGKAVWNDPRRCSFVIGNVWWNARRTLRNLAVA